MKIEFTKFENGENWVQGTVDNNGLIYTFYSKLFDEDSEYGIREGRVSKLSIVDERLRGIASDFFYACIVNYDRGWDIEPENNNINIFEAVLDFLENAPKTRF